MDIYIRTVTLNIKSPPGLLLCFFPLAKMSLFTSVYKNPPSPGTYLKTKRNEPKKKTKCAINKYFLTKGEHTRISAKYMQQTQYPTLNYT